MRLIQQERGIALVMVLVLSLIALALVAGLMYMVTTGTRMSGALRFFRTAEEASIGGVGIAADLIRNRGAAPASFAGLTNGLAGTAAGTSSALCFQQKLTLSRTAANWANCVANDTSIDPTQNSDMRFDLGNYRVFAKIVDTVEGNSDIGGMVVDGELGGAGVVASTSGLVTPPHSPYLYRLEVQSQGIANARERSRVSALYAY